MTIIKRKPTSAGRRHVVSIVSKDLYQGKPYRPLIRTQSKTGGRNNNGHITSRHQGGGYKQRYRLIDFKRDKDVCSAVVQRIEYDPNRSANIALVLYTDGQRKYIVAPEGLKVGGRIASGSHVGIAVGNTLPIENIPLGTVIHCIELKPQKGAQLARSAGASAQLVAKDGDYATIRLRSGEIRKVRTTCRATIGQVGNVENNLRKLGKAGANRWRGVRPTVRGVAMNPIDHPHGGGEGKTSGGRHPVSPWGMPTKGYKTRHNKRTDYLIVRRTR